MFTFLLKLQNEIQDLKLYKNCSLRRFNTSYLENKILIYFILNNVVCDLGFKIIRAAKPFFLKNVARQTFLSSKCGPPDDFSFRTLV